MLTSSIQIFYSFMVIPIISPWVVNGNLTNYLELKGAALTLIRRFRILRDIIAVHANSVIHGDFTGPNVLIHGDGTACLADFGLSYSEVISASQASWTSTVKKKCDGWLLSCLYQRRRRMDVPPVRVQSDIFSFSGIMLQPSRKRLPDLVTLNSLTDTGSLSSNVGL
ncbi:uncharacterized protein EDB93DRAFT_1106434 [Suillus bovinus]|uniref:uncharacterized protein n=1 Tax=Suillus bovinus TaxID=48563 RepID=UPI001B877A6C|nr:uncharacterized protein EDB93DRAFT_1106434 [Suillus bovinus]KAG2138066.1 hypothetical protein EDB93DRAFT_1106434 [Suillus bovinus]